MFENSHISWLWYIIIVILATFVLFAAGAYMLWNYHFGKPLALFFWLRIKGWTTRGVALFEIFSLTNSVSLEEAKKEMGDGYRLNVPSTINIPVEAGWWRRKYNYLFAKNIKSQYHVEKVKRIQNLIMPKSSYNTNGVNTILLWDLHPQLHTDVLEGVRILVDGGITTLDKFTEFVSNKENAEKLLFKNYNYRTFYDLYTGAKQKFEVSVTTDDVANLIGKNFDKNYRETIEAKDFNMLQQNKQSGKTVLYGYLIIAVVVIAVAFKIIYNTLYR